MELPTKFFTDFCASYPHFKLLCYRFVTIDGFLDAL